MTIADRIADRFKHVSSETPTSDAWLDRDAIAQICPSCAVKMASMGITRVRASVIFDDERMMASMLRGLDKTAAWESLPKGWTEDSVKKFWGSLTGDVKHKVTKCIKKMENKGGIDDAGAFCASLADKIEGKDWRSNREAASRPAAKGSPGKEALSDAWDHWEKAVEGVEDQLNTLSIMYDEIVGTPYMRVAKSLLRGIDAAERQTYSWRTAFNLWLSGRPIDVPRMIDDIQKTVANLGITINNFKKFEGLQRDYPEIWKENAQDYAKNLNGLTRSVADFKKAVTLLKAGKY